LGNGLCSALASSHGARIHTSRSSGVVRITVWPLDGSAKRPRSTRDQGSNSTTFFFVTSHLRCRKPTYGLPYTVKRRMAEILSFVFGTPRQPLRGIIYVQKLNYLAAVVTLKRLVPKIRFGHLSIAYRAARVHRRGIAPDGFPRSSKLSEVAPQHGVKGRQMIVLGELSANTLRTVAPTKLRASALVFR
jgi:hypothetical protein